MTADPSVITTIKPISRRKAISMDIYMFFVSLTYAHKSLKILKLSFIVTISAKILLLKFIPVFIYQFPDFLIRVIKTKGRLQRLNTAITITKNQICLSQSHP